MTSTNEIAQKSFNPSWMQTASPLKMPKSNGMNRASNEDDDMEMMDPIFAKHRYGREDILALIPKDQTAPPEGLQKCPFFVEKPLTPIILTGLNETELRLQQNINSSKALSAARSEWQGKDNDGSNSPQTNNPWTIAGSSRSGSSFRGASNRWQNSSTEGNRSTKTYSGFGRPGYGAGNNGPDKRPIKNAWTDSNGGYKPTRQHLKSGSEEAPRTEDTEQQPKVPETNDWSSAWRSNDNKYNEKQKSAEPSKPPNAFNRASEIAKNEPKDNIWASTLHNSVWTPASSLNEAPNKTEKPSNNLTHSAAAASMEQKERSKATPIQPSPADYLEPDQWFYLDPQDTKRGPFSSEQMQAWFTSGYFQSDLRIRFGSKDFTTLGDLIKKNGALTPFTNSKEASPSPSNIPTSIPVSASWTSEPIKSQQDQATFGNHSIDTLKLLEVKERLIAEEQRKLHEKEEKLKREELERNEKNASLIAMQRQLEIQRQEIENRAREQERELELRRLQILEYEREQREKLEKLEQERKLQLQQEELNRRRMAEMQLAQEEKRRQELHMQAELKQQEERRKLELRLKQEEAEKMATAERLRLQQEQLAEYERHKAQILAQQQAQTLAQQQQAQALAQQRLVSTKAAPWSAAPGKQKNAAHFSEIQEQEQMEALRRQIEEEKRRESEAAQKRAGAAVQNNGSPWNVVKSTSKPVPIPPAKEPQSKSAPAKVQKKSPVKEPKKVDPLTDWVVQRIVQMDSNVESEVFATFLIGLGNPNEIEDYIFSYFGETKTAKQFHQDFLAKRIELRPRRGVKKEDDLSSPAQASDGATVPGNSGAKGGKKSKKGKKVDLTAMMNFRPVGDATRFNAGEIDLDIPAASKKGKKK